MRGKEVFILILFAAIGLQSTGQTYYLPKLECDCPETLKYCAAAFDSIDFHKNFHFMLCADGEITQQGIFLRPHHFVIKARSQSKILFRSNDSLHYEIWSKNEELKIAIQVNTFNFRKSVRNYALLEPQHAVIYTIHSSGRIDSAFTFYFPRINQIQAHQLVVQFYSDIEKEKLEDKSHFNCTAALGSILLATLNGDKQARDILANFSASVKDLKKACWEDYSWDIQNAMALIALQNIYNLLK